MKKHTILGAIMLTMVCALSISTSPISALETPTNDDADATLEASQTPVSQASLYQSLQELLELAYRTPDYAANPALQAALETAAALDENSDSTQISAAIDELSQTLAALPALTADGGTSSTSGSTSGGGDPADDFEEKHEPSNTPSSTPEQPNSEEVKSNNTRVGNTSTPNTGVADQSTASSAAVSVLGCFMAIAILTPTAMLIRRHYRAKK